MGNVYDPDKFGRAGMTRVASDHELPEVLWTHVPARRDTGMGV